MSIRIILAGLLAFTFAVGIGAMLFSMRVLQGNVLSLFPPTLQGDAASALQTLLLGQAIALLMFSILLGVLLFWLLGSLIASPLRRIVSSMNSFSADGQSAPFPKVGFAPREVRELAEGLENFASRVELSHKRDMQVSQVKSDFISTAAHQLRTPLTGIRWALEALEKGSPSEEQKALITSAVDKSKELVAIVGTLLDISSIESGKYKYDFQPVVLEELIEEVARDFSPLATKNNVSFFYARSEAPLPKVRADRERIKWVLTNLVENGIRYTPAGGSVQVTTEANSGRVYVKVRDTGIGIKDEDRDNIFERFYRAGNAIAKENGGNGLGLYIARTIATDHGGDINFATNPDGPGTTFSLSLPLA